MKRGLFTIITPYFKETPEVLKRCIDSVKHQSIEVDHFLVSDGYPQDWVDRAGVRHLRLGTVHKDWGNTPRGIGALLAISEGYKAIGFLDADNWYDLDHVEQCCAAENSINGVPADLVAAKRRILLADGTATNLPEHANHVDTSCYWLLEGAFSVAHYWLTMAPQVAHLSDRIFYRIVKDNSLTVSYTKTATVNFVGNYAHFYRALGKTPPRDAKTIDRNSIISWIKSLDSRQLRLASRRCGIDLLGLAEDQLEWLRTRPSQSDWRP
jgi:glycosyltransferase involved in cell wall biosynthesis